MLAQRNDQEVRINRMEVTFRRWGVGQPLHYNRLFRAIDRLYIYRAESSPKIFRRWKTAIRGCALSQSQLANLLVMAKARTNTTFKVPGIGDFANQFAGE